MLCVRSNYKWYIKKVLTAPKNQKILNFQWSVSDNMRLYVAYKSGGFEVHEFCNDYGISGRDSGRYDLLDITKINVILFSLEDLAWAVSVDFNSMLLTPLGKLVIPPPMCKEKIDSAAIFEAFHQTKSNCCRNNIITNIQSNRYCCHH